LIQILHEPMWLAGMVLQATRAFWPSLLLWRKCQVNTAGRGLWHPQVLSEWIKAYWAEKNA
jgi:hypothetical protein